MRQRERSQSRTAKNIWDRSSPNPKLSLPPQAGTGAGISIAEPFGAAEGGRGERPPRCLAPRDLFRAGLPIPSLQGTPGPAGHPLSAVPLPPGDRRCPGAMGQSQLLCPFLEASPSPAPFPKTRARSRGGITDGDRCWAALTKGQQVHPARPHALDVLPKPESPPVILRRYHTGGG